MHIRTRTLGELAAEQPAATRVFLRHKLDFCCGGKQTLDHACTRAGLDVAAVERELADEAARGDDAAGWESRTAADLADHIVDHYHEALRHDMPPLIEAARKVERVHAAKPGVPAGLADELTAFWSEMQQHMAKEEQVLFPMLRRGVPAPMVTPPVRMMEREHDEHAVRLARIRELTQSMQPPPVACATWRALYAGLAQLEADLMVHIHLENNILFARATGDVRRGVSLAAAAMKSVLLVTLLLAACAKPPPPDEEAAPAAAPAATDRAVAAAKAKEIFAARCVPCHGTSGGGDGAASASLVPKPRNFQDPSWHSSVDDAYIEKIIKFGGAAVGKSPTMPSNPDLTDAVVVAELRAVVRTFKR